MDEIATNCLTQEMRRAVATGMDEEVKVLQNRFDAERQRSEELSKQLSTNWTFLVSGSKRSGTSMMMRCLELGGIPVHRNPDADSGKEVNKYGNYELTTFEWLQNDAWYKHAGYVVKRLHMGIYTMPNDVPIKCVFMLRHPDAVWSSAMKVLNGRGAMSVGRYFTEMFDAVQWLSQRKNVDLVVLRYEAVLRFPHESFTMLRENGWPINVAAAVRGVEKKLCRHNGNGEINNKGENEDGCELHN